MATFIDTVGIRAVAFGVGDYRSGMTQVRREAFITGNAMVRFAGQSRLAGNAVTNLGATVAGIGRNVSFLGAQMSSLGIRFSTFVTAPIIGAGAAIARTGAGFETELTKIETLVGINREQVAQWREEILRIAPTLGQLPTDLARGLFFITSAGVRDSTEAINALEVAAKGAAVGMGEINEVARALAAGMNSFGISAEEAGEVLLATVRESQVEATELAPVLGRVLSFVEELGGSFEDAGAFIATFTKTGVTASVATTALRSTLTSLIKPTESAKDALQQAGLSVQIMRDLIAEEGLAIALQILRKSLEDVGLELGDVITRSRGLVGALALTGEQSKAYLEVSETIRGSQNELADAFERVTETTEFQWNRFVASINVAAQHIADVLLPAINSILDRIVPLVEGIAELASQNQELVSVGIVMATIAASVGPALFIFGQFFATIGTGILLIGNLIITLGSLLTPIGLVTAAIAGLGLAFGGLVTTFLLTANDIAEKADISMGNLRDRMGRWGYEIIRSFAEGMINALTLVVRALNQLSLIFSKLLAPGSPPALLPEIDKWGANTAQEWVDGWLQADFSVFSDIAQQVSGLLRGLGRAEGVEQQDIASAILGSREGIAAAINQFRETGTVTQQVLDQITEGLGDSQQIVQDYITSMFRLEEANRAVEQAQSALTREQERYEGILEPLNERLNQINEQQAAIRRQDTRERLQQILEDPRATDEVRRRTELALEELDIRDEIARVEQFRDVVLDPFERRLELAQEQQEAIQAQVDAQRELVELIREQIDLLGRTVPPEEAAAAGGAATGGAGGDEIEPPGGGDIDIGGGFLETLSSGFRNVIGIFDKIRAKIEGEGPGSIPSAIENLVNQLNEDLEPAIKGLNEELDKFSTHWANILTSWQGLEQTRVFDVFQRLGKLFGVGGLTDAFGDLVDIFRQIPIEIRIVLAILAVLVGIGLLVGASLTGIAEAIAIIGIVILLWRPVLDGFVQAFENAKETFDTMREVLSELVDDIRKLFVEGDFSRIPAIIGKTLLTALLIVIAFVGAIGGFFSGLVKGIVERFQELKEALVGNSIIPDMVDDILEEWQRLKGIADDVHQFLFGPNGVVSEFEELVKEIAGANGLIPGLINSVRTFFQEDLPGALQLAQETIDNIVSHFQGVGASIAEGVRDGIKTWFLDNAYSVANAIYQALRGAIVSALSEIGDILRWLNISIDLPFNLGGGDGSQSGTGGGPAPTTPGFAGPNTTTASIPIVPGAAATYSIMMNFNVTINDDMDAQRFGGMVRREVSRAIRGT